MRISLTNAGKRFNREWIFRKADLAFESGKSYAITGPNGSGKSTLLQSIAGMLQLSEGSIAYKERDNALAPEHFYSRFSFCAPYLGVVEELTLKEFLRFHSQFKPLLPQLKHDDILKIISLEHASNKQIRYYSSGMKQRVKLAQAVFSDTPVLLLDEPCSNFDRKGIELYHHLIETYAKDRIIIVCSNDEVEYSFCNEVISISRFKNIEQGTSPAAAGE